MTAPIPAPNAARELAATGTPGPWFPIPRDAMYNPCVATRLVDGASLIEPSDGWVAECSPETLGDADATKIVRAVNALGPLGDLLDAIAEHKVAQAYTSIGLTTVCNRCGLYWPCPTARARDAVEAALRGESS